MKLEKIRNQSGRFTNFSLATFVFTFLESFRVTSPKNMSYPFTPFHRSVNERNILECDLDNNNSWFGNRQNHGYSFFQEHCDVAKFTPPTSGYSNNASFNFASFARSQNIAKPRDDTLNTIDLSNFQLDRHLPTDKNILETECHGINLNMNTDPIPVPDDYQEVNDEIIDLDIDHIVLPYDNKVSSLTKSTKRKHSLANHSYIDFSRVEDEKVVDSTFIKGEKLDAIINVGGAIYEPHDFVIHKVKPTTQNRITFPTKLMSLLENNPDPNVITWLPHGRAFILKDNTRFMNELSSFLCKSNNFQSFQRMLNIWGFKRLTGKRDKGAYYHQMFLKGRPNLVKEMSICKKKNGIWPLANPANEPDFYLLSTLRPLHIA